MESLLDEQDLDKPVREVLDRARAAGAVDVLPAAEGAVRLVVPGTGLVFAASGPVRLGHMEHLGLKLED